MGTLAEALSNFGMGEPIPISYRAPTRVERIVCAIVWVLATAVALLLIGIVLGVLWRLNASIWGW
jgi:hypothetical protein